MAGCRSFWWKTPSTKKGKVTRWTWITNLPLARSTVEKVMRAERGRWKIENETFNFLRDAEVEENTVFPIFVPVAVADEY
jgi:hypothetical protein